MTDVLMDLDQFRREAREWIEANLEPRRSGVKAGLQLIGNDCGPTRPPSAWPLTDNQMKKMRESVQRWGLKVAR